METSSLDSGVSTTGDSKRLVSWAGTESYNPGQPGLLTVVPLHRPLLPAWVPENSDGTIFTRFHRLSLDLISPNEARPQLGARVQGSEWSREVFKIQVAQSGGWDSEVRRSCSMQRGGGSV